MKMMMMMMMLDSDGIFGETETAENLHLE